MSHVKEAPHYIVISDTIIARDTLYVTGAYCNSRHVWHRIFTCVVCQYVIAVYIHMCRRRRHKNIIS